MNHRLRAILKGLFIETTTPFRSFKQNLTFLYGHHLGVKSVEPNVFYENLNKLKKNVTFIGFDEACHLINTKVEPKTPVACFCFDDGFEEVINQIVPVLNEFNANCCIFINPSFIDASDADKEEFYKNRYHLKKKPSSWDELSAFVSKGGIVGSHTNNHFRLSGLSSEQAANEIITSKNTIEEKLKVSCEYFAWPYGTSKDITPEQLDLVLEYYKFAFSAIRSKRTFHHHPRVINRDHFEGDWKYNQYKYFLSILKNKSISSF